MSTFSRSRRNFLLGLGGSGVVAPFLPVFNAHLEAAGDGPPKRLLFVFRSLGVELDRFWPTGTETEFDFPVGGSLEALAPFKSDLIVPRNLERLRLEAKGKGNIHVVTTPSLVSHSLNDSLDGPGGPSFDQIIAQGLPRETAFESIQLGAGMIVYGPGCPIQDACMRVSYRSADDPLPPEEDPRNVYATLFGNFVPNADALALVERRKSVLDLVGAELNDVRNRVGQSDRNKFDRHLEAVRDIERLLEVGVSQCGDEPTFDRNDYRTQEAYPDALRLHTDLLVEAFACDRTRIATVMWSSAQSYLMHLERLGLAAPGSDEALYGHHAVSHDDTANAPTWNLAIERWHNEQFAYLLDRLRSVPEGDGTLLDNTLVVMAHELPDGNGHGMTQPHPVVLAGSLGGTFKTGRSPDFGMERTWHQMLLTICHAMGVPVDNIGDEGKPGIISELLA